jgi:hypothetical protein
LGQSKKAPGIWKTAVSGVPAIVVAAAHAVINMLNCQHVDYAMAVAGIGLITAKDNNK